LRRIVSAHIGLIKGRLNLESKELPIKKLVTLAERATLGVIGAGLVRAQSDAPYNEDPVWGDHDGQDKARNEAMITSKFWPSYSRLPTTR